MKTKRYFIKNYLISIVILCVMDSVLGYIFFFTNQYLGLFALAIITFILLNRRIDLYEDKLIIFQGYKKISIELDLIASMRIADYKPKFSKAGIPAIYVNLKNGKAKTFYYSSYSRDSMTEIINHAIKKNSGIRLDANIRSLLENKESIYDIKRKKSEKQTFILMIVALVITLVLALFGK